MLLGGHFRPELSLDINFFVHDNPLGELISSDRIDSALITTPHKDLETAIKRSKEMLDAWTREVVQRHFDPATGCPFWLDFAEKLDWDPRKEIQCYADLDRFGNFQDEWLRGGPVRRWVPKAYRSEE